MAGTFDRKEFKALQALWYRKLEKSGFEDIEDTQKKGEPLKRWDSTQFQRERARHTFSAKQTYYERASAFLEKYRFHGEIEKSIWAMHTEGEAIRTIAKALKLKIWFVHRTILRLRALALK